MPKKKPPTSERSRKPAKKSSSSRSNNPDVLISPNYRGKPSKLQRDTYPGDSGPEDFRCYGPAATKDGELDEARVCDLGCFTQDGKDSNKYYHGAVVQHRETLDWFDRYLENAPD